MSDQKNILLTWDAHVHGFAVTAKTLLSFLGNGIQFTEVFYLENKILSGGSHVELGLFQDTISLDQGLEKIRDDSSIPKNKIEDHRSRLYDVNQAAFQLSEAGCKPAIIDKLIKLKSPSDYESIYAGVRELVDELWNNPVYQAVNWYINISPGTPQMHVVWLMLNERGHFPPGTQLWSSQLDRGTRRQLLEKVEFNPQSYLSEIFEQKFRRDEELPILPEATKSEARRLAEERIRLFGSVPNASLLLTGERGVGKTTYVKRFLKEDHSKYPFLEIDCGILGEDEMKARLFGNGSAGNSTPQGLHVIGQKGILLLKGIESLGLPNQKVLLQVLETGRIAIASEEDQMDCHFTLVCTSRYTVSELSKRFLDAAFLDRIARYTVVVPPLRESREDLPTYWRLVWKEITNFDAAPQSVDFKLLGDFLNELELKGNFRDLQRIACLVLAFKVEKQKDEEAVRLAMEEYLRISLG